MFIIAIRKYDCSVQSLYKQCEYEDMLCEQNSLYTYSKWISCYVHKEVNNKVVPCLHSEQASNTQ